MNRVERTAVDEFGGRTVMVTGGGSGIGRATVLAFARAGANVVVADRVADRVDEVVEEARALGVDALGVPTDVGRDDDMVALRDRTLDRFGRVDVVMNNVGIITIGRPETIPMEEWRHAIDVNLLSVVRSIQQFVPLLLEQGEGHVVNTASTAGLFAYAYERLPYTATKSAIVGMSEALALYLRPQGVGVSVLCPGPVSTNIGGDIRFHDQVPINSPAGLQLMEAEPVGQLVVDAVRENRFLVLTHPDETHEILVRRATDPEAFVAAQAASVTVPDA
jgi:NAD(P)-dependent dehydrogenase (short-subunit alcohol dehydrogenase family)